jgi:hypothetical protein
MKTIVITIQVPDGANVQVTQGGQQQAQGGGNGDFVARPAPDFPDAPCANCGSEQWRLIKAGFSKTKKNPDGSPKRFNAFYVCGTDGCDGKPGQVADPVLDELGF